MFGSRNIQIDDIIVINIYRIYIYKFNKYFLNVLDDYYYRYKTLNYKIKTNSKNLDTSQPLCRDILQFFLMNLNFTTHKTDHPTTRFLSPVYIRISTNGGGGGEKINDTLLIKTNSSVILIKLYFEQSWTNPTYLISASGP